MRSRTARTAAFVLLTLLALLAGALAADEAGQTLTLSLINGVYTDLSPDLAPIDRGPVTIAVSSPSNRLAVHGNRLELATVGDAGDGLVAADFSVEFEGEGELIAVLDAGMSSTIEDEVLVPRQTLRLAGTIRLRRLDSGFEVVLEKMPPAVEVRIESQALGRLVDLCAGFASVLPLSCDGLARELSHARVPLPPPGATVFLPDSFLTDAERATFMTFASSP